MTESSDRQAGDHLDAPRSSAARVAAISIAALAIVVTLTFVLTRDPETPDDTAASDDTASPAQPSQPTGDTDNAASLPLDRGPSWAETDDPRSDGWSTEVFHDTAKKQLAALGKLLVSETHVSPESLAPLLADTPRCSSLLPENLSTAFRDATFTVERSRPSTIKLDHTGLVAFTSQVNALREKLDGTTNRHKKFKVVHVERKASSIDTRQFLSLSGAGPTRQIEIHASCRSTWSRSNDSDKPRIASFELLDIEIVTRAASSPLLSDCTASVLDKNRSYESQLLYGLNHWLERIQDRRFFTLLGTPGLAVGDVNGDGLDDLYLCQEGGLPNRLFIQNADGSATDASESSGANWLESSRSALLVDLDNDGRQDLVVAAIGTLIIARGDGSGHFRVRATLPTSEDTMSLSAVDHDNDGDLDIYLCSYKRDDLSHDAGVVSIGASSTFVYHDANNAAANYLFRNDVKRGAAGSDDDTAAWTFTDVTRTTGLDVNNRRFSFAAAWEDYDRDGDLDLYVANDFGRNTLYRRDPDVDGAPRFSEVAAAANAEDSASGMAVAWGDYDRDGLPDVHISNMFSAAGRRITTQREFKPEATQDVRDRLLRFARGNTLLRGRPDARFDDASVAANITLGRWAWGSCFVDLNGDGWDDLVVANGYITTDDTGDL